MKSVIPFSFENKSVRIITDEHGEVWFVGKDLCEVLGYANASDAMKQHCKGVAKRYPLQTPGGVQNLRILGEADMLRLVVNSTLPAAQAFERLVFEEILPSIRKTGSYGPGTGQDVFSQVDAVSSACWLFTSFYDVAELVFDKEEALACAERAVVRETGISVLDKLAIVHAAHKASRSYTTEELGKMMSPPVSGESFNLLLEAAGLQYRPLNEWVPTPKADGLYEVLEVASIKTVHWFGFTLAMIQFKLEQQGDPCAIADCGQTPTN